MKRMIISLDLMALFSYCSLANRLMYLCCKLTVGSHSAHATVTPRISLSKAESSALLFIKLHEVSVSQILNHGSIFQHINSLPHRETLFNNQGHLILVKMMFSKDTKHQTWYHLTEYSTFSHLTNEH